MAGILHAGSGRAARCDEVGTKSVQFRRRAAHFRAPAAPSVPSMPDLTRRQWLACLAGLAVVLVLGIRELGAGGVSAAPGGAPLAAAASPGADAADPTAVELTGTPSATATATPDEVVVHVAGAVAKPGVYRLARGERVDDAIQLAGGATRRADLGGVNLAAVAQDGTQILVPRRGHAATATGTAPAGATDGAPAASGPVNLNAATLEQLDTLAGVGPVTAQKILDYREQHGGFRSVDELGDITGIGPKRLEALRGQVTV
jgi:competence protein ComEA